MQVSDDCEEEIRASAVFQTMLLSLSLRWIVLFWGLCLWLVVVEQAQMASLLHCQGSLLPVDVPSAAMLSLSILILHS